MDICQASRESVDNADLASTGLHMGYYRHHVFFCVNERDDGRAFCNQHDAEGVRGYAKECIKKLNMNGPGKVRINTSGCLDRCSEGPVMVVYPEDVWYTYVDKDDIDEIISEHLQHGRVVERLKI
jgi:(2Fe-2S) ferredoxin